jgi:hypothetical protein
VKGLLAPKKPKQPKETPASKALEQLAKENASEKARQDAERAMERRKLATDIAFCQDAKRARLAEAAASKSTERPAQPRGSVPNPRHYPPPRTAPAGTQKSRKGKEKLTQIQEEEEQRETKAGPSKQLTNPFMDPRNPALRRLMGPHSPPPTGA